MLPSGAGEAVLLASAETNEVLGCAVARLPRPMAPGGEGEVASLHACSDFQGGGVGQALFNAAGVWLAAEGCRSMIVWRLAGNPAAQFCERLGGTPAARRVIGLGE